MSHDVEGVLLIYHQPVFRGYSNASTVMEHVGGIARHSRFPVFTVNTDLGFPRGLERLRFKAVLMHYSLFGSGTYLLGPDYESYLDGTDAYKVAFFQDEHGWWKRRIRFLNEHPVDCVFTHCDPRFHQEVFHDRAPVDRVIFNLPGYVTAEMVAAGQAQARPDRDRDIDVSYRGRPLPLWMGRGGREKWELGVEFARRAAGSPLTLDIDVTEEGRLYGNAWWDLLGRSRSVLGAESGTSFMDLEDEVLEDWRARWRDHPGATFGDLEGGALGRWDNRYPYRTMGPRHFEAAAFRCCQVLLEGDYSGVMEPMRHYIPLRKDYGNLDEVIALLQDGDARREISQRAFDDLVASGRWTYERFVAGIDDILIDAGLDPERAAREDVAATTRAIDRDLLRRRLRANARHAYEQQFANRVYPVTTPLLRPVRRRLATARDAMTRRDPA
jgi:hypothetical protein